MALSPMLVILPAGGLGSCRALVSEAMRLHLGPRFVFLDQAALELHDLHPRAVLRLEGLEPPTAVVRLMEWASEAPPASIWTPWREDDRMRFDLADRLADALPKAPVVFEYALGESGGVSPPPRARTFALPGHERPVFLVLD